MLKNKITKKGGGSQKGLQIKCLTMEIRGMPINIQKS